MPEHLGDGMEGDGVQNQNFQDVAVGLVSCLFASYYSPADDQAGRDAGLETLVAEEFRNDLCCVPMFAIHCVIHPPHVLFRDFSR